jgi:hypothetical protein
MVQQSCAKKFGMSLHSQEVLLDTFPALGWAHRELMFLLLILQRTTPKLPTEEGERFRERIASTKRT